MAILDAQIGCTVGGTNTAGFQWSNTVIARKVLPCNQSLNSSHAAVALVAVHAS